MKRLIILGSTGSIGVQALEVAERNGYKVTALAAGKNTELLEKFNKALGELKADGTIDKIIAKYIPAE